MRTAIRYPAEIPIELHLDNKGTPEKDSLINVSLSGLSFSSQVEVPIGTWLKVCIPLIDPPFEAVVRVVWCESQGEHYDLGVELPRDEDAFRTRMIEQVCHIEEYRKKIQLEQGRDLSPEEAALEWINQFAEDFPPLETDD